MEGWTKRVGGTKDYWLKRDKEMVTRVFYSDISLYKIEMGLCSWVAFMFIIGCDMYTLSFLATRHTGKAFMKLYPNTSFAVKLEGLSHWKADSQKKECAA